MLTPKEASKLLGISRRTLRDWVRKGIIRAVYLPTGRIRIPESEIQRIIEEGGREDDNKN